MEFNPKNWGKPTQEEMEESQRKEELKAMEKVDQETTGMRNSEHSFEVNPDGTIREARTPEQRAEDRELEDIK